MTPPLANPLSVEVGAVYEIIGPDGTRAVINDRADPDFVGTLNGEDGVTGLERAGVRESADDLPDADGGVHGAFRYGRLTFTLKGLVSHEPGASHVGPNPDNLLANPSFETSLAGWSGGGSAFVRSTAWAKDGAASVRATATGGVSLLSALVPVVPGNVYTLLASFNVLSRTAPGNLYAYAQWFTAGGAHIGDTAVIGAVAGELGLRDGLVEVVAPANAATARAVIFANGQGSGSIDGYVDAVLFARGTPHTYITPWTEARVRAERISRLLRATNAMRSDSLLLWTPTSAPPVRVAFRQQQPTRITGRRPKAFLVAGVSELAVIEAQAPDSLAIPMAETNQQLGTYGGTGVAVNNGSAEAWPVITIPAGLVNPVVTSHRYGRSLVLFGSVGAAAGTETFVIDTDPRRRTITVNGVARYSALHWPASAWFPLGPGDNALEVSAEAGAAVNVTVQWRQAWG